VAPPGGGGVLELLVAVVAVVLPQGHPAGCSRPLNSWGSYVTFFTVNPTISCKN
jgi:hypothetical protein